MQIAAKKEVDIHTRPRSRIPPGTVQGQTRWPNSLASESLSFARKVLTFNPSLQTSKSGSLSYVARSAPVFRTQWGLKGDLYLACAESFRRPENLAPVSPVTVFLWLRATALGTTPPRRPLEDLEVVPLPSQGFTPSSHCHGAFPGPPDLPNNRGRRLAGPGLTAPTREAEPGYVRNPGRLGPEAGEIF